MVQAQIQDPVAAPDKRSSEAVYPDSVVRAGGSARSSASEQNRPLQRTAAVPQRSVGLLRVGRLAVILRLPAWTNLSNIVQVANGGQLSERSCLARTGEVAAPSWMEQSVDVGDVWSLLVQLRSPSKAAPSSRRSNIGIVERRVVVLAADGRPETGPPGRLQASGCPAVPRRLADDPVALTHDSRSDLRPFGIAGVLRSGGDSPWIACVWSWWSAHEKNCW